MGVYATHYVVYGVIEPDKDKVKEFFKSNENYPDLVDDYEDASYRPEIKSNNGINAIVDGMNGSYVIFGKILYKSLTGFKIIRSGEFQNKIGDKESILTELRKIDEALGTSFASKDLELLILTHWH